MNWTDYLRFLMAFIFVIGLMGGFYLILKRLNLGNMQMTAGKRRLRVVESLMLDSRHRAVILQRDDKEHLVILSPTSETVIETGIEAPFEKLAHDQNSN